MQFRVLLLCILLGPSSLLGHDGVHVDVDRINELISKSDDPGPLYLMRAKLCRAHGRPELGLKDCQVARGCGVDPTAEKFERALCLRDTLRHDRAMQLLDELVNNSVAAPLDVLSVRSSIREWRGDIDGAIIDLARVHAVRPDLETTLRLGSLFEKRKAHGLAASLYRQMMERAGESILLTIGLIRAESARGHPDAALQLIDAQLENASLKAPWLQRKAEVLTAAGRVDEANTVLEAALSDLDRIFKRRPVPIHRVTRARILRQLGRLDEASSELKLVLQQAPGYETARSELELVEKLQADQKR
jgi:tetratricopeptide (TPR) repeat protein